MIKRADSNQKEIMDMCRKIPALSVFSTHTIGKGFPDIVIGFKGINYLIEIKDGSKFIPSTLDPSNPLSLTTSTKNKK
jgi:hypothetical protein